MVFDKDGTKLDINIIENVKKIFNTIAIEIGNGKIKYLIEGDSIIITVEIGDYSLEIKITPIKGPLCSTNFENITSYVGNAKWKDFLIMSFNVLSSISIFSPKLNLTKLII